jgi:hypothetical protein
MSPRLRSIELCRIYSTTSCSPTRGSLLASASIGGADPLRSNEAFTGSPGSVSIALLDSGAEDSIAPRDGTLRGSGYAPASKQGSRVSMPITVHTQPHWHGKLWHIVYNQKILSNRHQYLHNLSLPHDPPQSRSYLLQPPWVFSRFLIASASPCPPGPPRSCSSLTSYSP